MSETKDATPEFEELAGLLKASFPDLRCLRCGHDKFYLAEDSDQLAAKATGVPDQRAWLQYPRGAIIALACTRCGHIEQHLVGMLRDAEKPIIKG